MEPGFISCKALDIEITLTERNLLDLKTTLHVILVIKFVFIEHFNQYFFTSRVLDNVCTCF